MAYITSGHATLGDLKSASVGGTWSKKELSSSPCYTADCPAFGPYDSAHLMKLEEILSGALTSPNRRVTDWRKVMSSSTSNYSPFEKQLLVCFWAQVECQHMTTGHQVTCTAALQRSTIECSWYTWIQA